MLFRSTIGTSIAIANKVPTVTLLYCSIQDIRIIANNIGIGFVINWNSFQQGSIKNVWVLGSGKVNCTGINLTANWAQTECTYNLISGCYIGLATNGIVLGDGANNTTIFQNRIQPNVLNGNAILFAGTAAGRISCTNIIANGFEYPGKVSNGIHFLGGVDTCLIQGNRFEQLNTGIITILGCINIVSTGNYFSSCAINTK